MTALVLDQIFSGSLTVVNGDYGDEAGLIQSLGATIDPTKAIVLFDCTYNSNVNTVPNRYQFQYTLDATTLKFRRSSNYDTGTVVINWQVIVFTSGVTVEHGTFSPVNGANVITLASSAPVSRSVILVAEGGQQGAYNQYPFNGYLNARTTDTQFTWTSQSPTNASDLLNYQAWVFDSDAITSLQQINLANIYSTATATITAVDLSNAIIIPTGVYNGSTGGADRNCAAWKFNSTTQIQAMPYSGAGSKGTTPASCYVLEIPSLNAEHGALVFGPTDSTKTATLAAAGKSPLTFNYVYQSNWSNTATYPTTNKYNTQAFDATISGTTLTVSRAANGSDITYYYQAVIWPSAAPGTLVSGNMDSNPEMTISGLTQTQTLIAGDMDGTPTQEKSVLTLYDPAGAIRQVLTGMAEGDWLDLGLGAPIDGGVMAYSGGCYIAPLTFVGIWGGGHTDSGDSAFYGFDLENLCQSYIDSTTPTGWVKKTNTAVYQTPVDPSYPLPPPADTGTGYNPTKAAGETNYAPIASHSYNMVAYSPYLDQIIVSGGSNYHDGLNGLNASWLLDPKTWQWRNAPVQANQANSGGYHSSWIEEIRRQISEPNGLSGGKMIDFRDSNPDTPVQVISYGTLTFTSVHHLYVPKPGNPTAGKVLWAPFADTTQAVIVDAFDPYNPTTKNRTYLAYANAAPSWIGAEVSCCYRPGAGAYGQIWIFKGPDMAYLDVETNTWFTPTQAGDIPPATTHGGTYGRFMYIAEHDAFLNVDDATQIYKPASWSPLPAPPSAIDESISLGIAAGLVQSGLGSGTDSISLGLSAAAGFDSNASCSSNLAIAYMSGLALGGAAAAGDYLSLNIQAALTARAGMMINESLNIGLAAGVSQGGAGAASDAITLAQAVSLDSAATASALSSIALGLALGLSAGDGSSTTVSESISLGLSAGLLATSAAQANDGIAVDFSFGFDVAGAGQCFASLRLGLSSAVMMAAQASAVDAMTFGFKAGVALSDLYPVISVPDSRTLKVDVQGRTLEIELIIRSLS